MAAEWNQRLVHENWNQISDEIISRWPHLTEDDLAICYEDIHHLPERLLMRYDWDLDRAQAQFEQLREKIIVEYSDPQMYGERHLRGSEVPADRI